MTVRVYLDEASVTADLTAPGRVNYIECARGWVINSPVRAPGPGQRKVKSNRAAALSTGLRDTQVGSRFQYSIWATLTPLEAILRAPIEAYSIQFGPRACRSFSESPN